MYKRLACKIPQKLHDYIRRQSKKKNITMTRYITRALLRYSLHEQKYEDKYYDHQ